MKNFIDMFLQSSLLSIGIMALLVIMSSYCWAIAYIKWRRFRKIMEQNKKVKSIVEGRTIKDVLNLSFSPPDNPLVRLLEAIKTESPIEQFSDSEGKMLVRRIFPDITALRERLDAEIEVILAHEERKIGFLATTATVAPFMGLLGTVLGITFSFWEIGKQSTANIAVVAPGLAEALITTIVGLLVAIPAALTHHIFHSKLRDLVTELQYFSRHLLVRISKEK